MRKFAAVGIISAIALGACNLLPETTEKGCVIILNFAHPLNEIATKVNSVADTNDFILSVRNVSGAVVYEGKYGLKPSELKVSAGTYELSVRSSLSVVPDFDSPIFGDSATVMISDGENMVVTFVCRQINCGVKMNFSDRYLNRYGKEMVISDLGGKIKYVSGEERYAYFMPGNVVFSSVNGSDTTKLFSKVLTAGKLLTMNLDASCSESVMSIIIDTSVVRIAESIIVGKQNEGGNGSSADNAVSVSNIKNRVGDTIWVQGYIVGGDLTSSSVLFHPPFIKKSNMAIAHSPSDTVRQRCVSVELSKVAIKNALNLVQNPGNLGKKVILKGVVEASYFGLTGIKNVSEYKLE